MRRKRALAEKMMDAPPVVYMHTSSGLMRTKLLRASQHFHLKRRWVMHTLTSIYLYSALFKAIARMLYMYDFTVQSSPS